jgi:hypothetical protein
MLPPEGGFALSWKEFGHKPTEAQMPSCLLSGDPVIVQVEIFTEGHD